MDAQGIAWIEELNRYAAECRRQEPIVERDQLSVAEETQRRIIGKSLRNWLDKQWPDFLKKRRSLATINGGSNRKKPFIVFTSSQPGLLAAREIFAKSTFKVALLYPNEYAEWKKVHPDKDFAWHVHFLSAFAPMHRMHQHLGKTLIEKHPLKPGESYTVHEEVTSIGPSAVHANYRLWKWNGKEAVLLGTIGNYVL